MATKSGFSNGWDRFVDHKWIKKFVWEWSRAADASLFRFFLLDQKQEQEAEQITHNTLASYRSMICQHIRPKWGDAHLKDVRPTLVQDWLRSLDLSPKYKGHVRSLMYRLFDKAMLWELLEVDRNPMDLVEVKGISKRKKRPCVLQVKDAWQMLDALVQPFRTIVLIGLCFEKEI